MPTELAESKKRCADLEKIVKNFELEMNTVKVLVGHVVSDIDNGDEAHLEAARAQCSTIRAIAESFR